MKKKILLFPGAFQAVKNYGNYSGVDIWLKPKAEEKMPDAEYFIGHSAGALKALTLYDPGQKQKFILVNLPIKKMKVLNLLFREIKFMIFEGIGREKIVPIGNWLYGLKKLLDLLKIDVLGIIQKIPKEDVVIIRGSKDNFFCDKEGVEIIKENNINLVEADAGHNWNENIAEKIKSIIGEAR